MNNILKVLITSIPARGHLNCCIGFGDLLKERGHEIYFAQREGFREMAESHGFEFIPFNEKVFENADVEPWNEWTRMNSRLFRFDGVERYRQFTPEDCERWAVIAKEYQLTDRALTIVFRENKFIDVVVSDVVLKFPSIYDSGVPSVSITSLNPLILYPNGVPAFVGFSTKLRDEKVFEDYRRVYREAWKGFTQYVVDWYISCGKDDWAKNFDSIKLIDNSADLGFYHYAYDMDYHEFGPTYPIWNRVDCCVRKSEKKFQIPDKLRTLSGRLIYFSMGSLASMDHEIMKMLLKVLSKSPHRFIVSTGACGNQLELYENMWGQPYVDQIEILQTVDLVITHGGNNTLMETLYYARPMIVIPYFFDQLDNARRVEEKKVGNQINIWNFNEEKLLNVIEEVLNDHQIKENVKKISENMKNSVTREEAAKKIENLVNSHRSKKEC